MASKSLTLTALIDKLNDSLGLAEKPSTAEIRGELTKCRHLAEALESGQSAVEAEKEIATLKATIEELEISKADIRAQLEYAGTQHKDMQAAIDAAKTEIANIQNQGQASEPVSILEGQIMKRLDFGGENSAINLAEPLDANWIAIRTALEDLLANGFVTSKRVSSTEFYRLSRKGKAWAEINREG